MERTDGAGNATEDPPEFVSLDLAEGVVLDAVFIERTEPMGLHNQEQMEEDDDFLSVGTEVWEYDVADGREQEFIAALENSQLAIEYQEIDNEEIIR